MDLRNQALVESRTVLTQKQFYQRMNALKRASHGEILVGSKSGWYRFESWMRGYVRLKAEQAGLSLASITTMRPSLTTGERGRPRNSG